MDQLYSLAPFILIAVLFWMLMIRPARRRQAQLRQTQASLEYGTEVMLGSGIYGRVVAVHDDTIDLEIAPGSTMKVARAAIVRVVDSGAGSDQ